MLTDYDNRLVVDFENMISLESFLQLVVRREEFILREIFPSHDQLVARGPEGRFASEIEVSSQTLSKGSSKQNCSRWTQRSWTTNRNVTFAATPK